MNEDFDEGEEFLNERKREIDMALLKQTLKRGNSMPLNVEQFTTLFGKPQKDDLDDLTTQFIAVINGIEDGEWTHIMGMDNPSEYNIKEMKAWIVDGWGDDWIKLMLQHNEDKENYEDCERIWECLKCYANLENFVNKSDTKNLFE